MVASCNAKPVTYQNVHVAGHFLEDRSRFPAYQSRANNLMFGLEYDLTDRLTADASGSGASAMTHGYLPSTENARRTLPGMLPSRA